MKSFAILLAGLGMVAGTGCHCFRSTPTYGTSYAPAAYPAQPVYQPQVQVQPYQPATIVQAAPQPTTVCQPVTYCAPAQCVCPQ